MQNSTPRYNSYALVIVRNKQNKYLSVLETDNRGWWVPGGNREVGETMKDCAIRETKEEGGIDIVVKGIIRLINRWTHNGFRQWIIFYAEPLDENQVPKRVADKESVKAEYLSVQEIRQLAHKRGHELQEYATYIQNGGVIHPLSLLQE